MLIYPVEGTVEMYHTPTILLGSEKNSVAALDMIPDAPWLSAALTQTITCGKAAPQSSA